MDSKITRRNFIKKTGAAGVGLTVLSSTGAVFGANTKRPHLQRPIIINSHGSVRRNSLGEKGNRSAWSILDSGGSALDAVEKCTNTIELDPNDHSVGYGGLPNAEGIVELDSTVFDGKTYNYGAVGGLRNIVHPSSVARLVMERTDHIMLCAEGALKFAKMHGYKEQNLLTDAARQIWLEWKENLSENDDYFPAKKKGGGGQEEDIPEEELDRGRIHGTVNVIAVDKAGDVAGITSTSGMAWKVPGRLGDSPIIGAGLYGDNIVGGAGATGRGEEVIKTAGSFLLIEFMRNGMSAQKACEAVCQRIIDNYKAIGVNEINFNDKFVALSKEGEIGCSQVRGNRGNPPRVAYMFDGEASTYEGTSIIEV